MKYSTYKVLQLLNPNYKTYCIVFVFSEFFYQISGNGAGVVFQNLWIIVYIKLAAYPIGVHDYYIAMH